MEGNSIKTFQNLCKIFEMKIKLDNAKGEGVSEEVVDNYEKYAQKIDSYYNEEFQKELKNLISPKDTLEKERERLEKLIDLLEDRLEKRRTLAGDFHRTTGKYIKNLQLIVSESELNNKKERLSLIIRYLDTIKEIENIKENVEKLKETLSEEEVKRDEYLEKNKILEDELYSSFVTSVSSDEYYSNIEEEQIIDILNEVSKRTKDTKETLDITKESVESLLSSGMDDEYESYIEEASKSYSLWKDREIILKIYKLVINFEDDFNEILSKRETINNLLEERKTINVDSDILLAFENIMLEQGKILNNEKEILENIANYTSRINFKEERLKELEEIIKEPEIIAILSEYNLALTSDASEEDINNDVSVEEHNPYEIISIDNASSTLNIGLAKLKGASVRDKINKKLNPATTEISEFTMPGVEPSLESENNLELSSNLNQTNEEASTKEENIVNSEINSVEGNASPDLEANNSFWVPVSDSKLESSEFPNINIPINNENINIGEDNFGFPKVND